MTAPSPQTPPRASRQSLSLRLLGYAAAAVAASLIIAWLVLGYLFERHSERQLQVNLQRDGIALIAALELDAQGRPHLTRQPADPRFSRPASGLYWRISSGSDELRSRSLWDGAWPQNTAVSPAMPTSTDAERQWVHFLGTGPFERNILVTARTVRPTATGPALLVEVASDHAPIGQARKEFGRETGIFLALLWLTLSAAAWLQVKLGLRPLHMVRQQLAAMSRSAEGRLPQSEHPVEIQPLTAAINDLAENRQQDIVRARQRARDLAHALKTPITALRLQIDALPADQAFPMTQSLSLLTGAVEAELARTGASAGAASTLAAPLADRLIAVIARTPDGQALHLSNHLPADLQLPMSMEAVSETLGALIENAARYAKTQVSVSGGRKPSPQGEQIWLSIADDGPGIAEDLRASALGRGVRLDERAVRHGLGLSIAQDFVTASGGTLSLETAELGGLDVRATWPASPKP